MSEKILLPKAGGLDEQKEKTADCVRDYKNFHNDEEEDHLELRNTDYTTMINKYYDMVTDFYEWGWGTSFHFAPRYKTEPFYQSLARHEHYLALKMKVNKGDKILDVGCGVGGPARCFARFAECHVTGVNNNAYQLGRAQLHTKKLGLEDQLSWVKTDFMNMPFEDNEFDGVYQIEATAHAPDKVKCYKEIFRVLKPGGTFASYEWCLTDKFDPKNQVHQDIKKGIEEGDGLPDIATTLEVVAALEEAGFEIEIQTDLAIPQNQTDRRWYEPLEPKWTPSNFQHTAAGKYFLGKVLQLLEKCKIIPAGTYGIQSILHTAAVSLVEGGKTGTFTPAFFTLARKPLDAVNNNENDD
jgi:sterol 24-C-methyltransferase